MLITALRALALAGILLVLILYIIKVKKLINTEDGKENFEFGKKNIVFNSITALLANFLDVEGIGTHAVNSIAFKMGKSVNVGDIPGTLNVGAAVPCCLAAFLFFPLSNTDGLTLILMIAAALIGAFLGSQVVIKVNTMGVRLLMGVGLIILSIFMLIRFLKLGDVDFPDAAVKLSGVQLIIGIVCSFVFGFLMNIGVGYYAPCLAVCSLLGLNLPASMAIMFGACSILMAFGSAPQFIKSGKFDIVASASQIIFGSIGVAIAFLFVKSLPISILSLIVALAVLLTGILFLTDYSKTMKKMR